MASVKPTKYFHPTLQKSVITKTLIDLCSEIYLDTSFSAERNNTLVIAAISVNGFATDIS